MELLMIKTGPEASYIRILFSLLISECDLGVRFPVSSILIYEKRLAYKWERVKYAEIRIVALTQYIVILGG